MRGAPLPIPLLPLDPGCLMPACVPGLTTRALQVAYELTCTDGASMEVYRPYHCGPFARRTRHRWLVLLCAHHPRNPLISRGDPLGSPLTVRWGCHHASWAL